MRYHLQRYTLELYAFYKYPTPFFIYKFLNSEALAVSRAASSNTAQLFSYFLTLYQPMPQPEPSIAT